MLPRPQPPPGKVANLLGRLPAMPTVAATCGTITGGTLAWYFASNAAAAHAWGPNIATSAATIGVTVTLIDGIVKREAARRVAPRVDRALRSIAMEFRQFAYCVAMDYGVTHSNPKQLPSHVFDVLQMWLDELKDADLPHARGFTPSDGTLLLAGWDMAEYVVDFEERDRDVLEPDLVMALRDLGSYARRARTWSNAWERRRPQGDDRWVPVAAKTEQWRAYDLIVRGAYVFGQVLARYAPEVYFEVPAEWQSEVDEWRTEQAAMREAMGWEPTE